MTRDDVRATAGHLVCFHERFAPPFGKEQAQDHAYTYVKGLMVGPERKSIEPIALNVGDGRVSACGHMRRWCLGHAWPDKAGFKKVMRGVRWSLRVVRRMSST